MVNIEGMVKNVVLGIVGILIVAALLRAMVPTLSSDLDNLSARGGLWSIMSTTIVSNVLIPAGAVIFVIGAAMAVAQYRKK